MNFVDTLQIILVSVCTGFGLELSKELMKTLKTWVARFLHRRDAAESEGYEYG